MPDSKAQLLEEEIEGLKKQLNTLMENYNGQVDEELVALSQKLDKVIDEYYVVRYKVE